MSQQPLLAGVDRATIVKIVAIIMAIGGVLGICGGITLAGVGGFLGLASVGTAPLAGATGDPEAAAALATGAGVGALTTITGILLLIEGIFCPWLWRLVSSPVSHGHGWERSSSVELDRSRRYSACSQVVASRQLFRAHYMVSSPISSIPMRKLKRI